MKVALRFLLFCFAVRRMLSASPEKRVDLRRLYTLISYLEDGETRGGGGAVENSAMKALEKVPTGVGLSS